MHRILLLITAYAIISVSGLTGQVRFSDPKMDGGSAVNQFTLSAFPEALGPDSVRMVAIIKIPYNALQFLKSPNGFKAAFEASIALQTEKGNQVSRKSWAEAIFAKDYLTTTNSKEHRVLETEFIVGSGKYMIIGDLMDQDTRRTGVRKYKLDLSGYSKEVSLLPLVVLEKRPGFSGFDEGEFPILAGRIGVGSGALTVLMTGRVEQGDYKINLTLRENQRTSSWAKSYDFGSEGGVFSHRIELPASELKSLKVKLNAELVQGKTKVRREMILYMSKPGISRSVTNVQQALEQMKYILKSDETKKLKKANRREKEELFIAFWAKRDPSVDTPENELMDEYYSRVRYSNANFETFQPGWKTDMGMIYILFGPPDEIERYDRPSRRLSTRRWYYYSINKSFTFVDDTGFGDYRLSTPYLISN